MAKKTTTTISITFPSKYYVCGADLSLKRPAWCVLYVNKEGTSPVIEIKKILSVDNKTNRTKTHGQLLEEIQQAFSTLISGLEPDTYFVRETEVLHMKVPSERDVSKVVGIMDLMLWKFMHKEWYGIYPTTVKKLITGSGRAEKDDVAAGLEKYAGKQEYKCDDESDATAVAVAWLIQQGEIKGESV